MENHDKIKHKWKIDQMLARVTNRMMVMENPGMEEKFPVSLIEMECWEWPQGVGLYGLWKRYCSTNDCSILHFLCRWFDDRMAEGVPERNVNTTAPMLTLSYVYEVTGKEAYLACIRNWAEWMMDDQGLVRAGGGCFQHMITGSPNSGEILIDTLFMAVLFLKRAGRILGREDMGREADHQIFGHIRYLYNREEGLFYHGYNFKENHNYGKVMWGRGNSWYTVGIMEYLEENPELDSLRQYYLEVFRSQTLSLKKYQDRELGLWHTVITNPDTYIEISASAAFLTGMMKGVRMGWLEKEMFLEVIRKGMFAILSYITLDGTVEQVSYGTPIGWDESFYGNIVCCPMTYGQALMILLLQEFLEPYWDML